jgi:hypothetical protein
MALSAIPPPSKAAGCLAWLGIPIFGSNFWDPHRKRNSDSVFDSKDSGQKIFREFHCWKNEKSEFRFQNLEFRIWFYVGSQYISFHMRYQS